MSEGLLTSTKMSLTVQTKKKPFYTCLDFFFYSDPFFLPLFLESCVCLSLYLSLSLIPNFSLFLPLSPSLSPSLLAPDCWFLQMVLLSAVNGAPRVRRMRQQCNDCLPAFSSTQLREREREREDKGGRERETERERGQGRERERHTEREREREREDE